MAMERWCVGARYTGDCDRKPCIRGALFQDAGDDSIARFPALFSAVSDSPREYAALHSAALVAV
jgi:hypothetical protein